jgi:hypothetical protein
VTLDGHGVLDGGNGRGAASGSMQTHLEVIGGGGVARTGELPGWDDGNETDVARLPGDSGYYA